MFPRQPTPLSMPPTPHAFPVAAVRLSRAQRAALLRLVWQPATPLPIAQRAQIVLAAEGGSSDREIARQLGLDSTAVVEWRARWQRIAPRLERLEVTSDRDRQALDQAVAEALGAVAERPSTSAVRPHAVAEVVSTPLAPFRLPRPWAPQPMWPRISLPRRLPPMPGLSFRLPSLPAPPSMPPLPYQLPSLPALPTAILGRERVVRLLADAASIVPSDARLLPLAGIGYLLAIGLAEALTAFVSPLLGSIAHIAIFIALLLHASLCWRRHEANFLMSLSIAPVIRIVSLGLPAEIFPGVWRYLMTSLPLFTMAFFLIQSTALPLGKVGLTVPSGRGWLVQGLVACSGVGLGAVEYMILRPAPLVEAMTLSALWWPALILIICTGLLEELIFRGIVQATTSEVFGQWLGIGYVSLLFGLLHSGNQSWIDIGFVVCASLYFGLVVARTRNLTGVAVAHGLTNVVLFLIAPNLTAGG